VWRLQAVLFQAVRLQAVLFQAVRLQAVLFQAVRAPAFPPSRLSLGSGSFACAPQV
jgi:hypothetical protein